MPQNLSNIEDTSGEPSDQSIRKYIEEHKDHNYSLRGGPDTGESTGRTMRRNNSGDREHNTRVSTRGYNTRVSPRRNTKENRSDTATYTKENTRENTTGSRREHTEGNRGLIKKENTLGNATGNTEHITKNIGENTEDKPSGNTRGKRTKNRSSTKNSSRQKTGRKFSMNSSAAVLPILDNNHVTNFHKHQRKEYSNHRKLCVLKHDIPHDRRAYTAGFKLEAIQEAVKIGNRAAGRKFGISEANIRFWRKEEELLKTLNKSKKANRGSRARFPELEKQLREWIFSESQKSRGVTLSQIRMKAGDIAKEMKMDDFHCSSSWYYNFIRRQNISWQEKRNLSNLQEDFTEKLENFRHLVGQKIQEFSIEPSKIVNMDEVLLKFDLTLIDKIEENVLKTKDTLDTCKEKLHFSVVLAVTSSGEKIPPMVVFKRKSAPTGNFPKGIIIKHSETGRMDSRLLLSWMRACYIHHRDGIFFTEKTLLVMASSNENVASDMEPLLGTTTTMPAIIPEGMTQQLQPLDMGVKTVFKHHLHRKWETHIKTGLMDEASLVDVATCIMEAWNRVKKTTIIRAFKKAKIIPQSSGLSDSNSESESDIGAGYSDTDQAEPHSDTAITNSRTEQADSSSETVTGNSNVEVAEPSSFLICQFADLLNSDSEEEEFSGFSSDDFM